MASQRVKVVELPHATPEKLRRALAHAPYDLVYFTGHGTVSEDGVGALVLEGDDGKHKLLPAAKAGQLFANCAKTPAVVFLNCCLSGAATVEFRDVGRRLVRDGVPFVVATSTPVFVGSSQRFITGFLEVLLAKDALDVAGALAAGRSAVNEADSSALSRSFFQYLLFSGARATEPVRFESAIVEP